MTTNLPASKIPFLIAGGGGDTNTCCVFCLRTMYRPPPGTTTTAKISEQIRFLILLQRYLKGGSAFDFDANACDQCWRILDQFSTYYDQLKCLEMEMEGMIWKLKNVMEAANGIPSRMALFRQYYDNEKIRRGRENLINTCSRKLSSRFPKVSLSRMTVLENASGNSEDFQIDNTFSMDFEIQDQSSDAMNIILKTEPDGNDTASHEKSPLSKGVRTGNVTENDIITKTVSNTEECCIEMGNVASDEVKNVDCDKLEIPHLGLNGPTRSCRSRALISSEGEVQESENEESEAWGDNGERLSTTSEEHEKNSETSKLDTISLPPAPTEEYTCEVCVVTFSRATHFRKHRIKLHDLTGLDEKDVKRCNRPGCSAFFRTKYQLNHHLRFRHDGIGLPNKPKALHSQNPKKSSKNVKHADRRSEPCSICLLKIESTNSAVHFNAYHDVTNVDPADVKRCGEENCSAYFLTIRQLRRHLHKVHKTTSSLSRCTDCGKQLHSAKEMRLHRLRTHFDPLKWKYSCSYVGCRRMFETNEDLQHHFNYLHTSQGEEKMCPVCGKITRGEAQLQSHMRCHDLTKPKVDRPHTCEQCGKKFKLKQQLKIHTESHTGPEGWRFKCDICGKKCSKKETLQGHVRTHTKEKPFVCQYCGKSFGFRESVKKHVRLVHKDVADQEPFIKVHTGKKDKMSVREKVWLKIETFMASQQPKS